MRTAFAWRRHLAWGFDLGSANTLVCSTSGEIVVNQPSVVLLDRRNRQVESAGREAYRALGRNPGRCEIEHPVRSGVVTDLELAEELLRRLFNQTGARFLARGHRAAVAVPSNATVVERRALVECLRRIGVLDVVLVDQLLAAAYGCGVAVDRPAGSLVIDVGAGLTEVGVLSLGQVVVSETATVGGDDMDQAIANQVRRKHRLLIGAATAEQAKQLIGSAMELPGCRMSCEVTGRCLVRGLPKRLFLRDDEVRQAIAPAVSTIIRVVRSALERVPAELSADLVEAGAVLTGGTALLRGLAERLSYEMQIPVRVSGAPLVSVAAGLSRINQHPELWRRLRFRPDSELGNSLSERCQTPCE